MGSCATPSVCCRSHGLLPLLARPGRAAGGSMPRIETTRAPRPPRSRRRFAAPEQDQLRSATTMHLVTRRALLRARVLSAALASTRQAASLDQRPSPPSVELVAGALVAHTAMEPSRHDASWLDARARAAASAPAWRQGTPARPDRVRMGSARADANDDALLRLRPAGVGAVSPAAAMRLADAVLLQALGPAAPARRRRAELGAAVRPSCRRAAASRSAPASRTRPARRSAGAGHVERGETPVALIALDRALVRRIRALLKRQGVSLLDETGWGSRLRAPEHHDGAAARHGATTPAATNWLDWLKACDAGRSHTARAGALEAVEAPARQGQRAEARAAGLDGRRRRRCAAKCGDARQFAAHHRAHAGRLAAMPCAAARRAARCTRSRRRRRRCRRGGARLSEPRRRELWSEVAPSRAMALAEFARWVDAVLERRSFARRRDASDARRGRRHAAGAGDAAAIRRRGPARRRRSAPRAPRLRRMPLLADSHAARARPADGARGATPSCSHSRSSCGLPRVTLLRRRADGGEPLGDSPFVERLALALVERGGARSRLARSAQRPRRRRARRSVATAAAAPPGLLPRPAQRERVRGAARLPVSVLRAAACCACARPRSSTPRSRSATTATGCTRCCMPSTRPRAPAADSATTSRACRDRRAGTRRARASTRPRSCRSPRRSSASCRAMSRGCTSASRRARAGSDGEVELRVRPEALGGVELYGIVDRIDHVDGGTAASS